MARRITRRARGKHSGRLGHWPGRLLPMLLIGAGLSLILAAGGIKLYTGHWRNALLRQYEEDPATAPAASADGALQGLTADGALPDPDGLANGGTGTPKNIRVLGVLRIPKLGLTVAVGDGVTRRTLRYAVGHFTGTALPGEEGNCAITGHRSYLWGEYFNRLDELEHGDSIELERGGATYTYIVREKFVVTPDQTWVLNHREGHELTLITCTPIRVATHRLVVKAVLVP
jgi:LPXTG-site transpeptidase (sortase) family protein